jgi:hypothetical protein
MPSATRDSGGIRIDFLRAHENGLNVYSKEIILNLIEVFKITFFKIRDEHIFSKYLFDHLFIMHNYLT